MFTIDAHLDLSMNAMEWNRDLRKTVYEIRERGKGMADKRDRAKGTAAFPELRQRQSGFGRPHRSQDLLLLKTRFPAGIHPNRHGHKRRASLPSTKPWKRKAKW